MKRDNRRMMSGAPSRVLLIAVAAACSAAALASVADQNLILTTYAAASPAAAVAFFGSGLGLLAAGCLAASDRATGSPWALCILAAIAWLAPALVGWEAGPPLVRSIGMSLAPLLLPVLVHLLRTVPPEQLNAPVRRTMVGAVYGIAAIASVGLALTTDPFGDLHCWSNCTDNAFLVFPDQQLAGVIETAWLWATVAVGFLAVLAATWQLLTSRTVARGLGLTVAVPAVLAVGLEAAYAAVLLRNPAEDPEQNPFEWIFFLRALAAAALAAGVVMYVLQCRHRRTALVKLIHELEASPDAGALTASLSRSFGDDSLKVAYWLPREGRFVWPSGPLGSRCD